MRDVGAECAAQSRRQYSFLRVEEESCLAVGCSVALSISSLVLNSLGIIIQSLNQCLTESRVLREEPRKLQHRRRRAVRRGPVDDELLLHAKYERQQDAPKIGHGAGDVTVGDIADGNDDDNEPDVVLDGGGGGNDDDATRNQRLLLLRCCDTYRI